MILFAAVLAGCVWQDGAPLAERLRAADPTTLTAEDLARHADQVSDRLREDHQPYGVLLPTVDHVQEDRVRTVYGNGGDAALFTGFRLAAAVSRLCVTRAEADWEDVFGSLRGLHLLTHVSGTPGVMARVAFPADRKARFGYPLFWNGRLFGPHEDHLREEFGRDGRHVYQGPADVPDILAQHGIALDGRVPEATYPSMIFYTRTSRDQYTGVALGLSVLMAELREGSFPAAARDKVRVARHIAGEILEALVLRLELRAMDVAWRQYRQTHQGPRPTLARVLFVIRDHQGHAGTATALGGMQKLSLLTLYREVLRGRGVQDGAEAARLAEVEEAVDIGFRQFGPANRDHWIHPWVRGYFPWNLRVSRLYTLFLHVTPERQEVLRRYGRKALWPFLEEDGNAWFLVLRAAMEGPAAQEDWAATAWESLQGLALVQSPEYANLRVYRSPLADQDEVEGVLPVHLRSQTYYFLWQKEPNRLGASIRPEDEGRTEGTGLDFLLPYWLGRAKGVLPPG